MSTEAKVAGHYGRAQLEELILAAVAREGKDLESLTAGDLAAVDEFHVGGLGAAQELARHMELGAGLRLVGVGSGVGGAGRYFAGEDRGGGTGVGLSGKICGATGQFAKPPKAGGLG